MLFSADRRRAARAPGPRLTTPQRRRVRSAALLLALLASASPAIAQAVVNEPPVLPHSIIVFPQRDFVSGSGFAPGEHVTYNVIRGGVTIATSDAVTADATGLAEVNHPGGGCWISTTPDILPGDQVRSTVQETGAQDQTTTANVTAERPTNPAPGTIVVRGSAQTATGAQLPIDQIEQRLVNGKDRFAVNGGKRTLRAPGDGSLAYDSATSVNFTATYTNLSAADVSRAMDSESRGMWLGASPATGQELTIYENPGEPGPSAPCTAPLASNAVTSSDHVYNGAPTVNIANVGTALGLSGVAQPDATNVTVTVSDTLGSSTTPVSVPLPGGTAGQTWSASIPAAQVGALADGTLTASMTYTTPGGTLPGASLTLRKDTIAPAAVDATPPGGSYSASQSVALSDADASASILYTTNNSTPATAPTANGITKLYSSALAVTTSQTIKALAVDPSGNPSTVATNVYTLVAVATLTPSAIDYGSQGVNVASQGVLVTMKNNGAAAMTISGVAIDGTNPGDFSRGVNTCTGATLSPGSSCTVDNVRFTPTTTGDRSAALTFTDSAPGSPHRVALSGTGSGPVLTASPNPLAFGSVTAAGLLGLGGATLTKSVSVSNSGNAPLTITTASIGAAASNSFPGDYTITGNTCANTTRAPGSPPCSIAVRFAPKARGARNATLLINSNAPSSPEPVSLTGTGA